MTFKKLWFIPILSIVLNSCGTIKLMKYQFKETVNPTTFKTQVSFIYPKEDRIFIPVFFEKENLTRTLLFDTHAPFCIFNSVIEKSNQFIKVGESSLSNRTPDGKKIKFISYLTDSVKFGTVTFNHILTKGVPDKTENNNYKYDGIFGDNLLMKGVWKIDFEKNIITFTNTIDSIDNLQDAEKITTSYSLSDNFMIDILFENNIKEKFEVDLGYNGYLTIPLTEFDKIDLNKKAIIKNSTNTFIVGTQNVTQYQLPNTTIKFSDRTKSLTTTLISSNVMKMKLIGVGFFSKFKFVVFDYPNKTIYISKDTR
jgi:predicted aspartyl protease